MALRSCKTVKVTGLGQDRKDYAMAPVEVQLLTYFAIVWYACAIPAYLMQRRRYRLLHTGLGGYVWTNKTRIKAIILSLLFPSVALLFAIDDVVRLRKLMNMSGNRRWIKIKASIRVWLDKEVSW